MKAVWHLPAESCVGIYSRLAVRLHTQSLQLASALPATPRLHHCPLLTAQRLKVFPRVFPTRSSSKATRPLPLPPPGW